MTVPSFVSWERFWMYWSGPLMNCLGRNVSECPCIFLDLYQRFENVVHIRLLTDQDVLIEEKGRGTEFVVVRAVILLTVSVETFFREDGLVSSRVERLFDERLSVKRGITAGYRDPFGGERCN